MAGRIAIEAEEPRRVFPWLTVLFVLAFYGIYGLEQHVVRPTPPTPSAGTLLALGGLNRALVLNGEAYRLLAAPFLHVSLLHLIFNSTAFAFAGYGLERLCGRAWTFCIFVGGAVAGAVLSLVMTTSVQVAVGASGGIMAMVMALFLVTFRLPPSRRKTRSQWRALGILVPALVPVGHSPSGMIVDVGAHIGGALLGGVVGIVLAIAWDERERLPPFRMAAAAVVGMACVSFVTTAYAVVLHYPGYQALTHLMPDALYPRTPEQIEAQAEALLASYPDDPRAYLPVAQLRAMHQDWRGAEQDFRLALTRVTPGVALLYPDLAVATTAALADMLLVQGRVGEAQLLASQVCPPGATPHVPDATMAPLRTARLCPSAS